MTQQTYLVEVEKTINENAIPSLSSIKETFFTWLSNRQSKKYAPDVYLSCIDIVSDHLISRKTIFEDLWQFSDYNDFQIIYEKTINDLSFRAVDKKLYEMFFHVGRAFLVFLKSKSSFTSASSQKFMLNSLARKHCAIKEAIIKALKLSQGGMTVKEIHKKIIEERLYSFDTKIPQDAIWMGIKLACDKTNVSSQVSNNSIKYEINRKGEIIYYLISESSANEIVHPSKAVSEDIIYQEVAKSEPKKIEMWNDSLERDFKDWLELRHYSSSAARHYCDRINRIVKDFKHFANASVRKSLSATEAIHEFVAQLNNDNNYMVVNRTSHNIYSAAINLFRVYLETVDHLAQESDVAMKSANANTNGIEMQYGDNVFEVPQLIEPGNSLDRNLYEKIADIISIHFANGFRLNSSIELSRFRTFYLNTNGKEISLSDEELNKLIVSSGIIFDGKVYPVSTKTKDQIARYVKHYLEGGAHAIFYTEFYEKNESWLFSGSVISDIMLIVVLREIFPKMSFTQTYFGITTSSVNNILDSEILRVWGDEVLLTYEQLASRLDYIPLDRIKYALSQNPNFIWNNTGEFTHVSKIDITTDEINEIVCFVDTEIKVHKYTSFASVPLCQILDKNYHLSTAAIQEAVYRTCLSNNFEKNGKIITRKGGNIDLKSILEDHCQMLDRCTIDELLEFEKCITGEDQSWISMEAGFTIMVRTDETIFVADKYVNFDKDAIDKVIDQFMNGNDYTLLRAVTTFALFPYCGQPWNLFLLESYCRRFSDSFRFEVLSVNSTNAGVIVRKNSLLTMFDIMADALARSELNLSIKTSLDFLAASGYISRRRFAKIADLIKHATALRKLNH